MMLRELEQTKSHKYFRNGGRLGVEYYSNEEKNLGNKNNYEDF